MDLLLKFLVLLLFPLVPAIDFVYIRSASFGQLITSNTLRWTKASHSKDPVTVPTSNHYLCHLGSGPRSIGLVEDEICKVVSHDGQEEASSSYYLLSGHASRVIWKPWQRPNWPPSGSVAMGENRFVAYSTTTGAVGHVDSKVNLGTCVFHTGPETQCVILTEVEPARYELSGIELKPAKGFKEEHINLTTATLSYPPSSDFDFETEASKLEPTTQAKGKSRIETILSYQLNQLDYWGQGLLMAKGLHTVINFPVGKKPNQKLIEWGIRSVQSNTTETVPVYEELEYGTAVNVTIRGIHRKGDMTYWAVLKTFYKDGSHANRHIEGQRKVDQVEDIHVEKSALFYVSDGSLVTTPTTVQQTTTTEAIPAMGEPQDMTSSQEQQQSTEPDGLEPEQSSNLMLNSSSVRRAWSTDSGYIISFTICTLLLHTVQIV